MKKQLLIFTSCFMLLMVSLLAPITGSIQQVSAATSDFVISNGVLTKYSGTTEAVTIPSGVKKIGSSAFSNNTTIKSVIIPYGVTAIGARAFMNCSELEKVTIPTTLKTVGARAFDDTPWFEKKTASLTVRNPYLIINNILLYAKNDLVAVAKIPTSVKTIAPYAMQNSAFTEIIVPYSVTTIGDGAFAGTSATKVTMTNSVTRFGAYVFKSCFYLQSVTLSNNITVMKSTFNYCTNLTVVNLPKKLMTTSNTFIACPKLRKVRCYANLKTIVNMFSSVPKNFIFYVDKGSYAETYAASFTGADMMAYAYNGTILTTYTVQSKDTLWHIADKLYGDGQRYREIMHLNKLTLSSTLSIGTKLIVPKY